MRLAHVVLLTLFTLATSAFAQDIRLTSDLPYKSGESLTDYERERCKLDIYLPPADVKNFRTVVWFHGGGLEGGEKTSKGTAGLAKTFAANGVACVVPNYRLSPKVKFPTYLDDAAASVAWTLAHIAEHGGDPKHVFVGGHSAGGYLAAAIGFDASYLAKVGVKTEQLAGLVPMSPQVFTHFTIRKERGVADAEKIPVIDEAAPAYHLRADAPRTLVLVGDKDWPARLEECQYFVAMAKQVTKHPEISLVVVADRTHGSILGNSAKPDDPCMTAMLQFIRSEPKPATQPTTQSTTQPAP